MYRSQRDRRLGGVCGGIAEYFHIDPTLVRLLWGMWALVYGTGIPFYFLAWLIIPARQSE